MRCARRALCGVRGVVCAVVVVVVVDLHIPTGRVDGLTSREPQSIACLSAATRCRARVLEALCSRAVRHTGGASQATGTGVVSPEAHRTPWGSQRLSVEAHCPSAAHIGGRDVSRTWDRAPREHSIFRTRKRGPRALRSGRAAVEPRDAADNPGRAPARTTESRVPLHRNTIATDRQKRVLAVRGGTAWPLLAQLGPLVCAPLGRA